MKIHLNPEYEHLRPFVEKLANPLFFARNGETLHDGRNVIKRFEAGGVQLAVKSYARLTLCNRILYGTLRKSKAERAYLHAEKLCNLGIGTPEEVAVVETRRHGILRQSYFVSLHSDYLPLRPVTEAFPQSEEAKHVLDAVACFLNRMHWAGILHRDLNIGNILYRQEPEGAYRFQVIDTNRMSFRHCLSMRQRLKNLRRLSCNALAYLYILRQYARVVRSDEESVLLHGVVKRLLFEWRQRTKRKVKDGLRGKGTKKRPDRNIVRITHISSSL